MAGGQVRPLSVILFVFVVGMTIHLTAREYRQEDLVLVRIAKTQDFVTDWGRNIAIDNLRGPQGALWFTPLDGNLQERNVGDSLRLYASFAELWDSFALVAQHAFSVGAQVYVEMPRSSSFWRWSRLRRFSGIWDMLAFVITDVCMVWKSKQVPIRV